MVTMGKVVAGCGQGSGGGGFQWRRVFAGNLGHGGLGGRCDGGGFQWWWVSMVGFGDGCGRDGFPR